MTNEPMDVRVLTGKLVFGAEPPADVGAWRLIVSDTPPEDPRFLRIDGWEQVAAGEFIVEYRENCVYLRRPSWVAWKKRGTVNRPWPRLVRVVRPETK